MSPAIVLAVHLVIAVVSFLAALQRQPTPAPIPLPTGVPEMRDNLMPWAILGVITIVSLYWKGYFKMPQMQLPAQLQASTTRVVQTSAGLETIELAKLMAAACRREAEEDAANEMAAEMVAKFKAAYKSPTPPSAPPAS